MITDFQQIIASPIMAYQEGLRFLMGEGILNQTLLRLVKDLKDHDINYIVIGGIALNSYGYCHFTEDIDLILTSEGLEKFRTKLVGEGYRSAFNGATKEFRTMRENVTVKIFTNEEFPGDGEPKPVKFPNPAENDFEIDGIKTVSLEQLIELKLASGMTAPHRLKDLADVQELIKIKNLTADYTERLNPFVREKFLELQETVAEADE